MMMVASPWVCKIEETEVRVDTTINICSKTEIYIRFHKLYASTNAVLSHSAKRGLRKWGNCYVVFAGSPQCVDRPNALS